MEARPLLLITLVSEGTVVVLRWTLVSGTRHERGSLAHTFVPCSPTKSRAGIVRLSRTSDQLYPQDKIALW